MLLADLLGLAAKFASKAEHTESWNNIVDVDSIRKMCDFMRKNPEECFPEGIFENKVKLFKDIGDSLWKFRAQVCHADVDVRLSDNARDSLLVMIKRVTKWLDEWV